MTRFSCYTIIVVVKNVTIAVEEDVAEWARIYAARHRTSVSRMLGEMLRQRMESEEAYGAAMQAALARPAMIRERTTPYPSREDLHDRDGLR